MAKTKSKKVQPKGPNKGPKSGQDPLKPAVDAFGGGDYITARRLLREKMADPELSTTQKEVAGGLIDAMGMDRGTLLVGIACVLLLTIVILGTVFTQP